MTIQNNILIEKTARYFLSQEPSSKTKHIWIVLHGYGMLGRRFIRKFDSIADDENIVLCPEGLHRFYWEGFYGKVVASWMTKEDRESDIKDNIKFLESCIDDLIQKYGLDKIKIHVIGFSQGTATASRWIDASEYKIDTFVIWAGTLAPEVTLHKTNPTFQDMKLVAVLGSEDEFVDEKRRVEIKSYLDQTQLDYEWVDFEGKHEILEAPLKKMKKIII